MRKLPRAVAGRCNRWGMARGPVDAVDPRSAGGAASFNPPSPVAATRGRIERSARGAGSCCGSKLEPAGRPAGHPQSPGPDRYSRGIGEPIESGKKIPGWAVAFSGTSSRMKYKDNFWLGL